MIPVVLIYARRRVDCQKCGVKSRMDSMGYGQESSDDRISAVPRWLGQADELERGGQQLSCLGKERTKSLQCKIEPMKAAARTLLSKRELLLNWFRAEGKLSSGVVEGFNNKAERVTRKSYRLRTQNGYGTTLYHNLGELPEPEEFTHKFF